MPLLENKIKLNESIKPLGKIVTTKRAAKGKITKDEYSLENLRDIFEDETKKENEHNNFKATSTPSNSQIANVLFMKEERIKSQKHLDEEINKIHDSINKESIIEIFESLSPPPVVSTEMSTGIGIKENKRVQAKTDGIRKKPTSKKATRRVLKPTVKVLSLTTSSCTIEDKKINQKKRSYKRKDKISTERTPLQNPAIEKQTPKPKTEPKRKTMTRSKTKSEIQANSRLNGKLNCALDLAVKSKAKQNPKSVINSRSKTPITKSSKKKSLSRVHFKRELSYKDLLLKCIKGKDPIDLLL